MHNLCRAHWDVTHGNHHDWNWRSRMLVGSMNLLFTKGTVGFYELQSWTSEPPSSQWDASAGGILWLPTMMAKTSTIESTKKGNKRKVLAYGVKYYMSECNWEEKQQSEHLLLCMRTQNSEIHKEVVLFPFASLLKWPTLNVNIQSHSSVWNCQGSHHAWTDRREYLSSSFDVCLKQQLLFKMAHSKGNKKVTIESIKKKSNIHIKQ
jgi:hypothetical protein